MAKEVLSFLPWGKSASRVKPFLRKHQKRYFTCKSSILMDFCKPTETKRPALNYRSLPFSTSRVAHESLTTSQWIRFPEPLGVTAYLHMFQFRRPRISLGKST